jgi:hypothetical protein
MSLSHARRAGLLLAAAAVACAACTDRSGSAAIAHGANQPPLGVIEEPAEGATVPASFVMRGWAGDDRGIRMIRVTVNGALASVGSFTTLRPDVSKVYPHLRHGTDRHGWEASVKATFAGFHVVRVEAVDSDGAATELGTRRVVVEASEPR